MVAVTSHWSARRRMKIEIGNPRCEDSLTAHPAPQRAAVQGAGADPGGEARLPLPPTACNQLHTCHGRRCSEPDLPLRATKAEAPLALDPSWSLPSERRMPQRPGSGPVERRFDETARYQGHNTQSQIVAWTT
jgi:hypothetical protein